MQFLKLPYELITDNNITSNEFRIYTYLLSRYNEEKQCAYPSMEAISEKINISLRTVKTCIKNLVKLGYMTIEKKKGVNGNYNEYKNLKHLIKGVVKSETITGFLISFLTSSLVSDLTTPLIRCFKFLYSL